MTAVTGSRTFKTVAARCSASRTFSLGIHLPALMGVLGVRHGAFGIVLVVMRLHRFRTAGFEQGA